MKIIKGDFSKERKSSGGEDKKKVSVEFVVAHLADEMAKHKYIDAFCCAKSDDLVVISTNMETEELNMLFDQLKLSLLTAGEYQL